MTKELEEIKTLRGFNKVELNNDENINKSLDIIEQALQRLEEIDNAKPSEALECLEELEHRGIDEGNGLTLIKTSVFKEDINIIKHTLKQYQELKNSLSFDDGAIMSGFWLNDKPLIAMPFKEYDNMIQNEEFWSIVETAIKDGIYVPDLPSQDRMKFCDKLKLSNIETEWYLSNDIICVNVRDYKTLFWFKEDKSE